MRQHLKNTEVVTEVRGEASRRPRQWIAKEQLIEKVKRSELGARCIFDFLCPQHRHLEEAATKVQPSDTLLRGQLVIMAPTEVAEVEALTTCVRGRIWCATDGRASEARKPCNARTLCSHVRQLRQPALRILLWNAVLWNARALTLLHLVRVRVGDAEEGVELIKHRCKTLHRLKTMPLPRLIQPASPPPKFLKLPLCPARLTAPWSAPRALSPGTCAWGSGSAQQELPSAQLPSAILGVKTTEATARDISDSSDWRNSTRDTSSSLPMYECVSVDRARQRL